MLTIQQQQTRLMYLNSQSSKQLYEQRQNFHVKIRRQKKQVQQAKQRQNNKKQGVYKLIHQNIQEEQYFNPKALQTLLDLIKQDSAITYIMLSNYIRDYREETKEVFSRIKDIKSKQSKFSELFRLSMHEGIDFEQAVDGIQGFIESENPDIVYNGFQCLKYMFEKNEMGTIMRISRLLETTQSKLFHYDNRVQDAATTFYCLLLTSLQTRHFAFSPSTPANLLYLLKKSKKTRQRVLIVLSVLAKDLSIKIHNVDLYKELILLLKSGDNQLQTVLIKLFLDIINYQPCESIKIILKMGLSDILMDNIHHYDVGIAYSTLRIINCLYQILEISKEYEEKTNLMNQLEQKYRLSQQLEDIVCSNRNIKISAIAQNIIESWYSMNIEDNFIF